MKIDPKYKDANKNVKLIFKLMKEDNVSLNDSDAAKSLTKLADQAENLKFMIWILIY